MEVTAPRIGVTKSEEPEEDPSDDFKKIAKAAVDNLNKDA